MVNESLSTIVHAGTASILQDMVELYMDLHAHPELSLQEYVTAEKMADHLKNYGYQVTTGIGGTGVVGVLENGDGPVVMLRADMDALPVQEETELPFASRVITTDRSGNPVHVMHACGHDIHMTCLAGAARLFSELRSEWRGTVIALFQPAEETSEGARAMIADNFFGRFPKPDIILGQHVINTPAGLVNVPIGPAASTGDSIQIRLIGRGSHGAMPENAIDPIVMAASTVLRLQTIVSREVPADEAAIITIGSLQAGTRENIIPPEAVLKVNVRTYDNKIRQRVLDAIERIVKAEAVASGATVPPELSPINHFSLVLNEANAAARVANAFRKYFPAGQVVQGKPTKMSDDFGEFSDASGVPAVYWFIGSTEPAVYQRYAAENKLAELPANHNPKFAPLTRPAIELGIQTLSIAALDWLACLTD